METTNPTLVFNHFYILRHDIKRTYILSSDRKKTILQKEIKVDENWISKIHPIYGMLFSFLSEPIALKDLIIQLSYFFDIDTEKAEQLILPFLEQQEPFHSTYGGHPSLFPRNIILKAEEAFMENQFYTPEEFAFLEFEPHQERMYQAPLTAIFMVTTKCYTDCVYCYASRPKTYKPLSFERITEIIEEAKQLKLTGFMLMGGELFHYKEWKKLLSLVKENGFTIGLISTKVPMTKEDVKYLKQFDDVRLQISLDSIFDEKLYTIVKATSGYFDKMSRMFSYLDKYEINFQVATVVTSYNCDIESIRSLYEFLKNFKSINKWEVRPAMKSLYSKANFDELNISVEQFKVIQSFVESIRDNSPFRIDCSSEQTDKYFSGKNGSISFQGARCSANYSNMMILPDGKVTICEQLYWDEEYIIGDLSKNSIEEVWNSPRALQLAFPKREDFRDESVCKSCKIFEECHEFPNKCIVDVIKGYGKENADFPDPRCSKAPKFIYNLLHT